MFREKRRTEILNYLQQHNSASVNELAEFFSVTKETIRADLRFLFSEGLINKYHGGAFIVKTPN